MLERPLSKASVPSDDMNFPVGATEEYAGRELEELTCTPLQPEDGNHNRAEDENGYECGDIPPEQGQ